MARTKQVQEKPADKAVTYEPEMVLISSLKKHPQNYKNHPEAQLIHIGESLKRYGFYKNVVVARDGTILAGHGVAEAAEKNGLKRIPVIRLDLDPEGPQALKVPPSRLPDEVLG